MESTSLAALLARECDAAPRGTVEAGIALGMFPTLEELGDRCRAALEDGYRRIKIKIEPGHDVDLAQTALATVEKKLPVSVDANASYSPDSIPALRKLDDLGLAMIEQPHAADDFMGHAQLQSLLRTPVCLDESVRDVNDANEMIALGSAKILNLKPGRVGGFTQSIAIHNRCAGAGVPLWCGGMLETGIGRAYNVALASLPNFTLPGDLSPSSRYWKQDVITEPWVMTNGTLEVPVDRIGTGVETDIEFIDHITVRKEEISRR
jgi:O-succinylbenzoate synthase